MIGKVDQPKKQIKTSVQKGIFKHAVSVCEDRLGKEEVKRWRQ